MGDSRNQLIDLYLQPTPLPDGVTSRELVRRAVELDRPARIPYSFFDPLVSDFCEMSVVQALLGDAGPARPAERGGRYHDEWGVGQEVTGRHWDHVIDPPLADLSLLDDYELPDVSAPDRYDRFTPWVRAASEVGKYRVGFDPVMMFERMRSLMGFEELMLAPYTQPDGLEALLDRLADLSIASIEQWDRVGGVEAYMTWEDWGLQTTLQMKVETFRQFYKPRYARIVEAAHDHGMHYIWHNCGQILDMIPDMIEIGTDVVQLDQPRLMGYARLAGEFGGRICFWNTVDIQWSTEDRIDAEDIRSEVAEMVGAFDRFGGGFMARHYPQGGDIGLSHERHRLIHDTFMDQGCALSR